MLDLVSLKAESIDLRLIRNHQVAKKKLEIGVVDRYNVKKKRKVNPSIRHNYFGINKVGTSQVSFPSFHTLMIELVEPLCIIYLLSFSMLNRDLGCVPFDQRSLFSCNNPNKNKSEETKELN